MINKTKEKWKQFVKEKKKIAILLSITLVSILLGATAITAGVANQEEIVYKETQVTKGDLTVGVTESGSVTIGTIDQTFDLDMSAYESDSSDTTTTSSGPGGNMFSMMQSDTTSSSTDYTREIEIEEVFVTAGQEVKKGEALFSVTQESTDSIRTDLESLSTKVCKFFISPCF